MKCKHCEVHLALYVEGDLSQSQGLEIETHLGSCTDCREIEASLRESQSLFKLLGREIAPAASLAGVRRRVLDDIRRVEAAPGLTLRLERFVFLGLRTKTVFAGLAVAGVLSAVALGVVWNGDRRGAESAPESALNATVVTEAAPVAGSIPEQPAPVVRPVRRAREKPAVKVVQADQPPTFVKIFTDDPNIVIYWALE